MFTRSNLLGLSYFNFIPQTLSFWIFRTLFRAILLRIVCNLIKTEMGVNTKLLILYKNYYSSNHCNKLSNWSESRSANMTEQNVSKWKQIYLLFSHSWFDISAFMFLALLISLISNSCVLAKKAEVPPRHCDADTLNMFQ